MKGYSAAIDAALDGRAGPGFSTSDDFALLCLAAADQAGCTARQFAVIREALECCTHVSPNLAEVSSWLAQW